MSAHFGHCEEFAIVEVDKDNKEILSTVKLAPPVHEPGSLPRWLHENGASIIIAGGMGRRAQAFFNNFGIEVIVGASAQEPEQIVADYLNGSLEAGSNICDH